MRTRDAVTGLVALCALVVSGCAPVAGREQAAARPERQEPRAPKILHLAATEGNIADFPGFTGRRPGGIQHIVHNDLVVRNDRDEFVPQLAAEQLSVERGTWRINPDGSMDTTWRLRPNVKWHDGAPFTSADVLFSFRAFKDPELPSRYGVPLRLMESAEAPDPLTLEIHWSRPLATANEAPALLPMPKHLLETIYEQEKVNLPNSPSLSTQFVGLGPYRMVLWERGSHIEFERFNDYFQGRPPLDRVVVRFIPDANTVVANLLAGTLDIAFGNDVDLETAVEIQRRWEGTGNQVRYAPLDDLQQLEVQYRPEHARPRNGLVNRSVRQALYQAIDRRALVEVATAGLAPVADSWFRPGHVLRPPVEDVIPQYPSDPARAQQLVREAGWARGGDGVFVHGTTGERFEVQIMIQDQKSEGDQLIIAEAWKALGVQPTLARVPTPRDRQVEATQPGVIITSPKGYEMPFLATSRLHSGNISTAENRWTGRNRGGYVNPGLDAILGRLSVTIDAREVIPLHRQLIREALGDLAFLPLYFDINAIAMQKGVKGPIGGTTLEWNFFQWDKE